MQRLLIWVVLSVFAGCAAPAASSAEGASFPKEKEVTELSGGEIIRARCIRCHHRGGTIFSLESSADVATHRETMGHVVSEGFMPAWLPSDSCVALAGARRLARKEREVLVSWLSSEQELPPGKPWPEPEPYDAQLTLQAQLEFPASSSSRRATMTEDIRCFAMGPIGASAMTAMRMKPDSVPGLEMAEVFAVPANRREQKGAECTSEAWPTSGTFLGSLTRVAPELRFPAGTALAIPPDSLVVIRLVSSREITGSQPQPLKPEVAVAPLAQGVTHSRVRFEHLEGVAGVPLVFPIGATSALRGLIPSGDSAVESITLQRQNKCLIDLPQWDRQFSELYRFQAATGVRLRENELLQLSCKRREMAARASRAACGFWLLLE